MEIHQLLIILPFLMTCSGSACGDTAKEIGEDWAEYVIPENYNHKVPPHLPGCPVEVNISLAPWGIGEISIKNMNFEVNVFLIFSWIDYRLNISKPTKGIRRFDEKYASNIWTPDVSFRNCMTCDVIRFDPPYHKLSLIRNELHYHLRTFGKLFCKFDLTTYPMDQHDCYIEVETFGDMKNTVVLRNKPFRGVDKFLREPYVPEFKISNLKSGNCSMPDASSLYVTCIELRMTFTRQIAYHLMLTYAPSILIVLLTWISFWLEVDAAPPRIALGLTSLLTLATQFSNAQKDLPPVSYAKAIDVWMFTCIFMVFGSLIEFAIAYNLEKNYKKVEANDAFCQLVHPASTLRKQKPMKQKVMKQNKNSSIDSVSKVLFPMAFLVFNICYWGYFCTRQTV